MSIFSSEMREKAAQLSQLCVRNQWTIATAESCTGGLLSALLTELPGASQFFTHGFITYANEAKIGMLQVEQKLLDAHGAVSKQVACQMAEHALKIAHASIAVGITGIAGPDGGTPQKPVGLVHIAVARYAAPTQHRPCQFNGDRSAVRLQAVDSALEMLLNA